MLACWLGACVARACVAASGRRLGASARTPRRSEAASWIVAARGCGADAPRRGARRGPEAGGSLSEVKEIQLYI